MFVPADQRVYRSHARVMNKELRADMLGGLVGKGMGVMYARVK